MEGQSVGSRRVPLAGTKRRWEIRIIFFRGDGVDEDCGLQ